MGAAGPGARRPVSSSGRGLSLDTGALIALERGDAKVRALLRAASSASLPVSVVAPVVAQAWRGGPRQAPIARLLALSEVDVPPLDADTARAVGVVCGRSGHPDVVDVHLVLHARLHGRIVVTSDPDDVRKVDPRASIVDV
jgi:predicted nucleic acid-binding protein